MKAEANVRECNNLVPIAQNTHCASINTLRQYTKAVVPKVCSADSKGSASSFHGIRGYISVMAPICLLIVTIKEIMFVKNNGKSSLTL